MSAADASRLALGTVQFGLNYGVANATGQVTLQEGRRILDTAAEAGMDTLDTAVAYGASEEVLGKLGVQSWRVITKLPPMPTSVADVQTWVLEQVAGSRTRLGSNRLGGVLMHRTEDLIRHP